MFSFNHLFLLVIFIIFLYTCLKITKNLLPYSYTIEKVICAFFIFEIVFEQVYLIYMGGFSFLSSLPISISNVTSIMCISILYFKNYQWFDLFFSWSLICAFGEIVFFEHIPFNYPDTLYFLSLASKCMLLFANIYLVEVKKLRFQTIPYKKNIRYSLMYFAFILVINTITNANYTYFLSNTNPLSVFIFIGATSLIYKLNHHLNQEEEYNL